MSPVAIPAYDDIAVGLELPAHTFPVRRLDLLRYAGASLDFNVIHWNARIAISVGDVSRTKRSSG